jgi:hypothetical protein
MKCTRPISSFVYQPDLKTTIETRSVYKNNPLLNFENRYVTKTGRIFVIMDLHAYGIWKGYVAKNITHTKRVEEERNLLL